MARSTVLLIVIGLVLAAAIAAAAVVAAQRGGEDELPDGTPGRTVQLYLRAVEDQDAAEAFSYLSPEVTDRCSTMPREVISRRGDIAIRATLEETKIDGDAATVRVELTERYDSSPFGSSDPKQTIVFDLERIEGEWLFSQPPWPIFCPAKLP
ncbi:MAG: hypothetical protein AB7L91_06585 [Dehalococcoidia bacterium]